MDSRAFLNQMKIFSYLLVITSFLVGFFLLIITTVDVGEPFTINEMLQPFEKWICWFSAAIMIAYSAVHYFVIMRNPKWWHTHEELSDAIEFHKRAGLELSDTEHKLSMHLMEEWADKDGNNKTKPPKNGDNIV